MKPIYLPLVFSLFILSGCSDKNNTEATSTSASEQAQTNTIDAESDKKAEKCVVPNVDGYDKVGCLRDGLAGVIKQSDDQYNKSNRVGYIDKEGQLIIPFEFDAIAAGEGGESLAFNDFSEGLAAISKNDKYGFIDTKGKVVIEPKYDLARDFSNGLAIVSLEDLYGAIDKKGKTIIPFEYEALADFQNGFAAAARPPKDAEDFASKYGLIDKQNKAVIPFMYESMGNLSESLIAVQKDGKWGYVDTSNKTVIPIDLEYETVNDFSEGLAAVFSYEENSDNLKYGYIDKTGKLVIPMQFTRIYWDDTEGLTDFNNGIAVVSDQEGRPFCIDKKGSETQCPEGIGSTDSQSIDETNDLNDDTLNTKSTDAPQFVAITDYIALKPNENWSWDKLATLPNVQEWRVKRPTKNESNLEDPSYSINAGLSESSWMMAYGTKNQPNMITFGSGQGVMEDSTLEGVYELNDFFNQKDLIRIASNCDVDSRFVQKFYKWQKKGFQPLYVYDVTMPGNSGTSTEFGIAKNLEEFFKPEYEHSELGLQSMDNNYDEVTCTFQQ